MKTVVMDFIQIMVFTLEFMILEMKGVMENE